MKIALLMQDTRGLYGAERASVMLARGLSGAGVEVESWLLEESRLGGGGGSPLARAFREAGVEVVGMETEGRVSRGAVEGIRRAVAERGVGLVHSTGYKADVHAAWAAEGGKRFPIVSTVHGWLFRRWAWKERFYRRVNVAALRRFQRVVVLSRFYEELMRRDGFDPLQLARIPTGLDAGSLGTGRERLWEERNGPFTFGLLGRLSEEKDQRTALAAGERLARALGDSPRAWRILVAGEGPLRERLERQAGRGWLAGRVEFAGRMDSGAFFGRTHALIQCSRVENQPMSILEAMGWGRPVLATRAGGIPEWVEDGRTGALVDVGDAKGLAEAMRRVMADRGLARSMGEAGREKLEREGRPEETIRGHLGLYEALAKG